MNFKYERLLNFCYNCGLLSHALKDYSKGLENNNPVEVECMQYGAWLKGELSRKGEKETGNFRVGGDSDSRHQGFHNRTELGGRTVKTGNQDENRFFKPKESVFLLIP